jgi:hypothetical protein
MEQRDKQNHSKLINKYTKLPLINLKVKEFEVSKIIFL